MTTAASEERTAPPTRDRSPHLLTVCWRQWRTERALRRRGIDFRTTDPDAARAAYAAMTPDEFAAINGRQAWANRRTIARSLGGLLPNRPISAVDLGCGIGESTRTLAALLPPGSRVLGLEFAEPLVQVAQARTPATGGVEIRFAVGSVTETFRDEAGEPLPDGSVDVVNASGIVGHHLDAADAARTADEIARVLKPSGLAALDPGPKLPAAALEALMTRRDFTRLRRTRSNPLDRTGQIVFRKG